jgi:uncharacterized protein YlaN (UPF0358 family)
MDVPCSLTCSCFADLQSVGFALIYDTIDALKKYEPRYRLTRVCLVHIDTLLYCSLYSNVLEMHMFRLSLPSTRSSLFE